MESVGAGIGIALTVFFGAFGFVIAIISGKEGIKLRKQVDALTELLINRTTTMHLKAQGIESKSEVGTGNLKSGETSVDGVDTFTAAGLAYDEAKAIAEGAINNPDIPDKVKRVLSTEWAGKCRVEGCDGQAYIARYLPGGLSHWVCEKGHTFQV